MKRYINKEIPLLIWVLSLAYYSYASVYYLTEVKNMSQIMMASLFMMFSTSIMTISHKTMKKGNFYKEVLFPLYIIILFWVVAYELSDIAAFSTTIAHISFFILPVMVYPIIGTFNVNNEKFSLIFFSVFILVSYAYYLVFRELNQFVLGDETLVAHLSASYLPAVLLPCILLSKKRLLHVISWLICGVILFSSLKRGGIVALVISFAAYMFFFLTKTKKWYVKPLIIILAVFLVVGLIDVFMAFDDTIGGITAKRFEVWSGGGYQDESRFYIYQQVINALGNSDFFSLLFGHGYLSVSEINIERASAHNDFLEVFYDFGLLCFVFYLSMHVFLIRRLLYLYRTKSEYAQSYAVFYSLFFVWSLVSIVILYPIMLFFVIYIARIEALLKKDKIQELSCQQLNT